MERNFPALNDVLCDPVKRTGNAMHAVQELPEDKRYIELSLSEKAGHLLLMEKNTVRSVPTFADGVPVTERSGHGLGARSIVYYVEKLSGQYQFLWRMGILWFGSSCKINKMFLRLFLSEKELFLWMYWEINAIIRIKDTEI